MRKSLKIVPSLISFFLLLPTLSLAGEFIVTRVYDGDTILVVRDRTDMRHPVKSMNQGNHIANNQRNI
jgi:hypothetical protein